MNDEERLERSLKSIGDAYVRDNPPDFPAFREGVLRRRRRRIWIQTGSALAFAAAAVAIGLFLTRAQPQLGRSLPPADGDKAITETVTVGRSPSQINVGHKAIWVTSRVPGTLTRIDPVTRHATPVSLGDVPNDLAVGGTGAWIANTGNLQHVALEPLESASIVESYPIASPGADMHVAISPGAVWVVVTGESVFRVDPDHPRDMTKVTVTQNPTDIAVGHGVLWVLDQTGEIQGFDARSGKALGNPINVETGENAEITLGADALWYGVRGGTALVRIDPATGEQRNITLPSGYVDMGVGRDEVWVLMDGGADRGSLAPIDAATGRLLSDRIHTLSGTPVDVAVGRQALWIINTTGSRAQRVDKDLLDNQ
jgi:streptogramin lyase